MRYLFLLLTLPFVLLPNCGGRASSPRGSGGEGGTDSGSSETGGSGSGGKGSSTGGKGSSTGGHGEATGGEGGESSGGKRTIEVYLHNNTDEALYMQIYANYCQELVFAYQDEDELGILFVNVGSVNTLGDEFGFIECASEGECSYIESDLANMPLEIAREEKAYYRRVPPGESFALYLHGVENEDIERIRAVEGGLNVLPGGFPDGYSWWTCEEGSWECDCFGDVCAIPEELDYYGGDVYYDKDKACTPRMVFTEQQVEWDTDPIRVDVEYWL